MILSPHPALALLDQIHNRFVIWPTLFQATSTHYAAESASWYLVISSPLRALLCFGHRGPFHAKSLIIDFYSLLFARLLLSPEGERKPIRKPTTESPLNGCCVTDRRGLCVRALINFGF